MENRKELMEKAEKIIQKLQNTEKEIIEIKIKQAESLGITDSKFGGCPYIPKSVGELPCGNEKNILTLLAQFNLEKLPKGIFPIEKGILQFFIDCEDDCYGMDFDDCTSGDGHKVIYYENIEEYMTKKEIEGIYSKLEEDGEISNDDDYKPFSTDSNMALEFKASKQIISIDDYRFDDLFVKTWKEEFDEDILSFSKFLWSDDKSEEWVKFGEDFFDKYSGFGHKLLGYAGFTQNDPRTHKKKGREYELLFQMDSDCFEHNEDEDFEICWGDAGICNFFIIKEDLEGRDFSRVAYNWDCS